MPPPASTQARTPLHTTPGVPDASHIQPRSRALAPISAAPSPVPNHPRTRPASHVERTKVSGSWELGLAGVNCASDSATLRVTTTTTATTTTTTTTTSYDSTIYDSTTILRFAGCDLLVRQQRIATSAHKRCQRTSEHANSDTHCRETNAASSWILRHV